MEFTENTIFRFRPYNPLTVKELLYGEIFFASKDELNDPYDTKNSAVFKADVDVYNRLVQHVLTDEFSGLKLTSVSLQKLDTKAIAQYLGKKDLIFDELIDIINSTEFEIVVLNAFRIEESIGLSIAFIKRLKIFIHSFAGGHCYIASFSKKCNDPVMWSHYSNNHKGFCLGFSLFENRIVSRGKSRFLNNEYEPKDVSYLPRNTPTNGFYNFSASILGRNIDERERVEYGNNKAKSFLTKFTSWGYEEEVRFIHDDWLTGKTDQDGVEKKSIHERIFYYDQKQLTSIVFGSKMYSRDKNELRGIIYLIREKKQTKGELLPVFVFYEAEESSIDYKMKIRPIDGLDFSNKLFEISLLEEKQKQYIQIKEHHARQSKINS